MARFGPICSVILPKKSPLVLQGFAIVTYRQLKSAKAALRSSSVLIKGKTVSLKQYDPAKKAQDLEVRKAFVVGIPKHVSEDQLYALFSTYVQVKEVKLVEDPSTGLRKTFGYVWTYDDPSFQTIIEQRFFECEGRTIEAIPSVSRQQLLTKKVKHSDSPNKYVRDCEESWRREERPNSHKNLQLKNQFHGEGVPQSTKNQVWYEEQKREYEDEGY